MKTTYLVALKSLMSLSFNVISLYTLYQSYITSYVISVLYHLSLQVSLSGCWRLFTRCSKHGLVQFCPFCVCDHVGILDVFHGLKKSTLVDFCGSDVLAVLLAHVPAVPSSLARICRPEVLLGPGATL